MKSLVIVESPSKAKTIKKYLGPGFEVKASKGHVVDLPKSKIGIDVEKGFKPTYVVTKKKSIDELKSAYKGVDRLVLAVDLDREGEAIGWHVAQKLGAVDNSGKPKDGHKVERIIFSEITKDAIQDAIKKPRLINMDLVNAQQARRFLDRLVGYKLSPVLWKKIQFGLSAGRVQSVALRLIVEREEERKAFKPEEYWSVIAYCNENPKNEGKIKIFEKEEEKNLEIKNSDLIKFELAKIDGKNIKLSNKKVTEDILQKVKGKTFVISDVNKKLQKRYSKPPFTTSTLQQTAVNLLGFSSKKTMSVAQKLYENGYITYMRTDSVSMSNQAIEQARKYVKKKFGDKYLPSTPIYYKTNSKSSQEAHECIRPADFNKESDASFGEDERKLYNLIRNRALASQMAPAEVENITAISVIDNLEFRATGTTILFEGYLKVTKDIVKETILPEISKGDKFYAQEIHAHQHFTQPPARFSEATLIKKLEELGIGRPSTYSSIISTIVARKYVEKESKYLFPTDVGIVVNRLLVKYFSNVVDYGFTSDMEDNLDKIAEGKLDWKKMLKDFYFPFEEEITKHEKEIGRDEFTVLDDAPEDIKCPLCNSKMIVKLGRFGRFYSCARFPDCKGMLGMDGKTEEELENEVNTEEFKQTYKAAPKTDDGRDYLLKRGKFGKFWAHPDYPKVKDAKPLEYTDEKIRELYGEAPKTDDGRNYLLRTGKFGPFWAHPDYPKTKDIVRIKPQSKN